MEDPERRESEDSQVQLESQDFLVKKDVMALLEIWDHLDCQEKRVGTLKITLLHYIIMTYALKLLQ